MKRTSSAKISPKSKRERERERKTEDRALVTLVSDVGRRGVSLSGSIEKA